MDLRCILHAHSFLSHDSRGTIAKIAAAAKANSIDAVLLSNHPKKDEDVVKVGQTDPVDGVLFVSGSETNGFLAYPGKQFLPSTSVGDQTFVDSVRATGGMIFVAHPEEHMDWSLQKLTGMEIYNTHADVKDETEMIAALKPKGAASFPKLLALLNTFSRYPQESFATIFDEPRANFDSYDQMAKSGPFAVIAGNDSHQNTGFVITGAADGKFVIDSPIGQRFGEVDTVKTPTAKFLYGEPVPGKIAKRWILDSYPVSVHYVSTHVLATERTTAAIQKALEEGRTYVAFDWICDPKGFSFTASTSGKYTGTISYAVSTKSNIELNVHSPLVGHIRLMKDGSEVASGDSSDLTFRPKSHGLYRVEITVKVGSEYRGRIYTGGIRVTD
ncbi:MAG: hypothetical protein ABJA67_15245 [Chthonomonadales bacterium]